MKKKFTLVLLVYSALIFCQEGETARDRYIKENTIKREAFINKVSDSLNQIEAKEIDSLPYFFTDYLYDRKFANHTNYPNSLYSVRKLILDNVTNLELLHFVLKKNDFRTKQAYESNYKGNYYFDKPFERISTYELVKFRVMEIDNLLAIGKCYIDKKMSKIICGN